MSEHNDQFDKLLQFFKVLGNENRLKIVGLLAEEAWNVGELADFLKLSEPTVSHHLALMKELGLVTVRAEGNQRIYALDTAFLENMSRDIFSQSNLADLVDETAGDAGDQKVLRAFVKDGRLRDIPVSRKKQRVVLKWLVQQLEPERRYHELELNQLLKRYYPDHASLRRYLVDEKFMARDSGNIYWRLPLEE